MIESIYIHIPFCDYICSYCDFKKLYYNEKLVNNYLISLENEIKTTYKNEQIKTIYIGGGTPSSLNIDQLTKLFDILKIINKEKLIEYTIESNIDSLTKEKLDLFKQNNINRLSIGVQSINEDKLKLMDRTLDQNKLEQLIYYSKQIGINNINCDLIYGLNNETINILEKDIDYLIKLDITHIAIYSLILEENTKLYINKYQEISEDLDANMYDFICKKLKDNNFIHYEISNFKKKGYQSNHNLCYWKNNYYYGFGIAASSHIKNKRYTNTSSITNYINKKYNKIIEELTTDDKIDYEIITSLRLIDGINKKDFFNKYNKKVGELFNYKDLIKKDYIKENFDNIYIEEKKLYISNEIINKFLESRYENEKRKI